MSDVYNAVSNIADFIRDHFKPLPELLMFLADEPLQLFDSFEGRYLLLLVILLS